MGDHVVIEQHQVPASRCFVAHCIQGAHCLTRRHKHAVNGQALLGNMQAIRIIDVDDENDFERFGSVSGIGKTGEEAAQLIRTLPGRDDQGDERMGRHVDRSLAKREAFSSFCRRCVNPSRNFH